jgi:hypothetical protein
MWSPSNTSSGARASTSPQAATTTDTALSWSASRRPFLVKNLENTLKKLLHLLEHYSTSERVRPVHSLQTRELTPL